MAALRARLLLAGVTAIAASGLAAAIYAAIGGPRGGVEVVADPSVEDAPQWAGEGWLVVDPVAGFRPRRAALYRFTIAALGDPVTETVTKLRDRHAFLRTHELPAVLDRPAVVAVGDSHVDGVVPTPDNFTSLLEDGLTKAGSPCYVLNAGCGFYSLWQEVLRARDLLSAWGARAVVVVVFLGNDFLDLENPRFPHLDDALHELPPDAASTWNQIGDRLTRLALPKDHEQQFWQGLNQALYLRDHPDRLAVLLRKAEHAIAAMQSAAAAAGARVVWTLLPSFDLVFARETAELSPLAREVVQGGGNRPLRDAFAAALQRAGATVVDLEPAFAADGQRSLYADDFHVFRRGHRLLAATLQPELADALRR